MKGAQWLMSQMGEKWPFKQIDEFNVDRYLPIVVFNPSRFNHLTSS